MNIYELPRMNIYELLGMSLYELCVISIYVCAARNELPGISIYALILYSDIKAIHLFFWWIAHLNHCAISLFFFCSLYAQSAKGYGAKPLRNRDWWIVQSNGWTIDWWIGRTTSVLLNRSTSAPLANRLNDWPIDTIGESYRTYPTRQTNQISSNVCTTLDWLVQLHAVQ